MARCRIIRPEFFTHEALFDAEQASGFPLRVAYAGLWCVADREGRFEWRPRPLKFDILPYDNVDFAAVLMALVTGGFIESYEVAGERYGLITTFSRHQKPHPREAPSRLPPPPSEKAAKRHGSGSSQGVPKDIPSQPETVSGTGIRNTESVAVTESDTEAPHGPPLVPGPDGPDPAENWKAKQAMMSAGLRALIPKSQTAGNPSGVSAETVQ